MSKLNRALCPSFLPAFGQQAVARLIVGLTTGVLLAGVLAVPLRASDATILVSLGEGGAAAVADVSDLGLSGDGRWVVFSTADDSLLAADTNGNFDVFVRDRDEGTTSRVSVHSDGSQGLGASRSGSISDNGRWVTFQSSAPNLMNGDTNGRLDVFLHDRDPDGNGIFDEPGSISTIRISSGLGGPANGDSTDPKISADGRAVAFVSTATDLFADFNGGVSSDVFVHDRDPDGNGDFDDVPATLVQISVGDLGQQGDRFESRPAISGDGRFVAFQSPSTDLVGDDANGTHLDVFLRDRDPDGNGLFDEGNGTTNLVTRSTGGGVADRGGKRPALSADGRWIAFQSTSGNLVSAGDATEPGTWRMYLRDRVSGETRLAVETTEDVRRPHFSADGRFLAFDSSDPNLAAFDAGWIDAFRLDRDVDQDGIFDEAGQTAVQRLSVDSLGGSTDGSSRFPVLSADGSEAVFLSRAENLKPAGAGGPEGIERAYLRGMPPPAEDLVGGWFDIEMGGVSGFSGTPRIAGVGTLVGDDALSLTITDARPLALTVLFVGFSRVDAPLLGGVLVPDPEITCFFTVGADKTLTVDTIWPVQLSSTGTELYYQAWIADPTALGSWSATNGLFCRVP